MVLSAPAVPAVPLAVLCAAATAAATTPTLFDVAPVKFPLVNRIVIDSAVLYCRPLNVATPLTAVAVVVPSSVPVPLKRVAVTTVVLSLATTAFAPLRTSTTGCVPNAAPAVGAAEGC